MVEFRFETASKPYSYEIDIYNSVYHINEKHRAQHTF